MSAPIRYLAARDVVAAMPPVGERLRLAERTMTALVADADLPSKIGVHPRPDGSFAHAMPASLRGPDPAGGDDLLGIKWVAGFPANAAMGLPAIHAVVVMSDPLTGAPTAILDGGPITAQRTAAVSGVAMERFGRRSASGGGATQAAIIGAGVQGHSHLEVIGHVLPGVHVRIFDTDPDRAAGLVRAAASTQGVGDATVAPTARDATASADVVVTAASFTTPERRQAMTTHWLTADALVIPVDYATMCAAEVARSASLFIVDERGQFLANREAGQFDDYPDPAATLGEAILAGTPRPRSGRVVVTHLGVGLADVIFAAAIVERARAAGLGRDLER